MPPRILKWPILKPHNPIPYYIKRTWDLSPYVHKTEASPNALTKWTVKKQFSHAVIYTHSPCVGTHKRYIHRMSIDCSSPWFKILAKFLFLDLKQNAIKRQWMSPHRHCKDKLFLAINTQKGIYISSYNSNVMWFIHNVWHRITIFLQVLFAKGDLHDNFLYLCKVRLKK